MDQNIAPLFTAVHRYAAGRAIPFHTPGHKQGKGIPNIMREALTPIGLKMDVSLMEELDDLFEPETCIKQAQDLAAELYAADGTFFMVNGTTGAIHVMLLSVLSPGDKVIMPRNVHKSVLGALVLCGAEPVFVEPVLDSSIGAAMAVRTENMKKAIKANKSAKAVLLVYPTYYGAACDIRTIAAAAHADGMVLLVDEAHGPHLKFSSGLPVQAIDAGADMAAQSTHKILASLTQTSMLHVKYKNIKPERVRMANSLIQSTSPNYLLLASLDAARRQMAQNGGRLINAAVALAQELRENINNIDGLYCFGDDKVGTEGCFALDYTKITVTVRGLGISGYEAGHILRHDYKIQCELADMYNVLFIISLADSRKETGLLIDALRSLAGKHGECGRLMPFSAFRLPLPEAAMPPRQAAFAPYEIVDFMQSRNRICAETITFYPPGIPLIYPGEIISAALIGSIKEQQQKGGRIVGPADAELNTIRVVK